MALSAVLTGLIRRTLPTAPMHGFDAAEAGSGKGLACSIVTMIVTGNRATAVNYSTTETEFRKLLFSALLANDQMIVLDNVTRPLEGDTLNSCLTEARIGDRILGNQSECDGADECAPARERQQPCRQGRHAPSHHRCSY